MAVKKISSVEEYDEIINSGKHIFVDFFAEWCGPCKMLEPFIHELAEQTKGVEFLSVDVDKIPALMERYQIMSIPTLITFNEAKETNKHVGFASKDKLKELIA